MANAPKGRPADVIRVGLMVVAAFQIFELFHQAELYRQARDVGMVGVYNKLARATGRPVLRPIRLMLPPQMAHAIAAVAEPKGQ